MKKIVLFSLVVIFLGFASCQNFDDNHPDYLYTSGYFPYQFPVRTLVLGDYIYDNSNDNAHKFLISVAILSKVHPINEIMNWTSASLSLGITCVAASIE